MGVVFWFLIRVQCNTLGALQSDQVAEYQIFEIIEELGRKIYENVTKDME